MMALWKEDKIGGAAVIRTKTKQKIKIKQWLLKKKTEKENNRKKDIKT